MSISNQARIAATLIACAALALPAQAQLLEPEPGVMDIARTPLEDLNIDRDDTPEILLIALRDPYASVGLADCNDIRSEIALLDRALGADFDIARDESQGLTMGGAAKSILGSFIPFRGVIRQVSGANDRVRSQRLLILAGMSRRAFLKGLGQGRDCAYPARPKEDRAPFIEVSGDVEVETDHQAAKAED
ncbi:MAG: hypothetical protein WA918_04465 [Erythrobacter sp.]